MKHSNISLDFLEGHSRDYEHKLRTEIQALRSQGIAYWPMCDYTNEDGSCAGHEEVTP